MKNNPSHEQLSKSLDRRLRHLMIKTLQTFEEAFPTVENGVEGQRFKSGLRTIFNEMMRAQRDELLDYEIEYRPLRLSEDNILAITQTFMQTVQKVEFGFKDRSGNTFVKFFASKEHAKVLEALRSEFGHGVVYMYDDGCIFEICGTKECVSSVLPVLDRYRLHPDVRLKYTQWRKYVVGLYTE